MSFDWQTLVVALIILAACAYVARRGLKRLRSFRLSGQGGARACETGCGSCGGEVRPATEPAQVLVQIKASRTHQRVWWR